MPKRIGRIAYAICFVVCVAPAMIFKVIGLGPLNLLALALGIASVGVTALRFHDFDRSGWWSLSVLVPFIGVPIAVVLMFWPGSKGENRFGPVPRF
ncbi:MAG: DUF805 domain-containing protein [Elusimicrobia bacterium]|nr:DUF805 domain-containing protein [Elusimicrobiota bacterium]